MGKRYCIDTSSLICLARYFNPFDDNGALGGFLKDRFEGGDFILLDEVYKESARVSGGLVVEKYPFLKDKNRVSRVRSVIALEEHQNKLNNNWPVKEQREKSTDAEFEEIKRKYIEDADFQIIAFCLEKTSGIAITEESSHSNDGKVFKKIPAICEQEGIECHDLVWLLNEFNFSATYKF